MPEPVADDFRRDAGLERERRGRVPELMKADRREARCLRVPLEPVREALQVDPAAELLREELGAQDRPDPKDLQRRFGQQEKERAERQQRAREECERQVLERELAYGGLRSGFHFNE